MRTLVPVLVVAGVLGLAVIAAAHDSHHGSRRRGGGAISAPAYGKDRARLEAAIRLRREARREVRRLPLHREALFLSFPLLYDWGYGPLHELEGAGPVYGAGICEEAPHDAP